jgi:mRNA-degrading endonuclease RelE of RelBE toxin-antitoxin system
MKNSLWSFGCSFTAEYHPIDNDPPNTYDLYKKWKGGNLPDIWPTLLSKKLNLVNQNKGSGAISNYRIFYNFCDYCNQIKENDTVIVQWTSPYRFLFADDLHFLNDILPSVHYSNYNMNTIEDILVNRTNSVWVQELIHFTKIINELCKEKGAKVFYWAYNEDLIWSYIETYWDDYNSDIVITPEKYQLLTHLDKATDNRHTIERETDGEIQDAHLGELGHIAQSEYFYNFIKNKI